MPRRNDAETRLPSAEIAERQQLGSREHLSLKEPQRDGRITVEEISQHRDHLLHLSHSRTSTDTLMSEMRWPDTVFLGQEHLRIAQSPS